MEPNQPEIAASITDLPGVDEDACQALAACYQIARERLWAVRAAGLRGTIGATTPRCIPGQQWARAAIGPTQTLTTEHKGEVAHSGD